MATFNKFQQFVADLANKVHNLGSDTIKVMLTDVAPVATNTIKSNITEIAAGNGYSSGGSIAQFRYAVLYNSTAASGNLIGWYDYGAEVNVTSGNSFQVQFDAVNGVLQLQ